MGKVNINEAKATTTARNNGSRDESLRGKGSGSAQGDLAKHSKVEKNIGVNMGAKNEPSAQKQGKKPEKKNNVGANKPVRNESRNGKKQLALPSGVAEIDNAKPKTNIVVHDELDSGMALMASRTAAAEYQKADITKIKQQRGKSMSGMLIDVSRSHARVTNPNVNNASSSLADNNNTKTEGEAEKERFSKMGSTLIGVGVALVVAVIGFAAIAIFGNNKEKCVVDFESNGGSKVESTEIVCGRTVSQPSDPTKEGFEFEGWIFEGDPFDFSTGIYKNATLVAKWKANEDTEIVKVSFDTDGGTAVSPIEVAKGKTMSAPNNPTKANWAFAGWYLDGKEFDFSTPIEKDITLKANWRWAPVSTGGSSSSNNNSGNNGGSSGSSGNNSNNGGSTNNNQPAIDDQNKPDDGKTENPSGGNGNNNGGNTENPGNSGDPGNTGGDGDDNTEGDNTGNTGGDDGNNGGGGDGTGGDDGNGSSSGGDDGNSSSGGDNGGDGTGSEENGGGGDGTGEGESNA